MILCPKCGKVKEYSIKEYVNRTGIFNENDERVNTTEEVIFLSKPPICLKCKSIVKFYIESQESEE